MTAHHEPARDTKGRRLPYEGQCLGKQSFQSARIAHQVQKRRGSKGKHGNPYRCPHCGLYHIGGNTR